MVLLKLCVQCRFCWYDQKEDDLLCSYPTVLSLVTGHPYLDCQEIRDEAFGEEELCGKEGRWWSPPQINPVIAKIAKSENVIVFKPKRTKHGELHRFNPPPDRKDGGGTDPK